MLGGRPARLRGVRDLLRPVADEPAQSIASPGTHPGGGSAG